MPYEFLAKNGLISQGNITATGSLAVTQNISASATGSFGIVGIGTNSPLAALDVRSQAMIGDASIGGVAYQTLSIGGHTRIHDTYRLQFGSANGGFASIGITGATTGTLTFTTWDGSAFAERLRIVNTNGNVGIGTTTVSRKLHTYTDTGPVMRLQSSGSNASIEFIPSSGHNRYNWLIGAQQNISDAFEITPSTATDGTTFSKPSILVKSDGNVGIGITSPTVRLHVSGSSIITNPNPSANSAVLLVQDDGTATTVKDGTTLRVVNNGSAANFSVFEASSGVSDFVILNSGNVGIGSTSPGSKLEVLTSAVSLANQPNIIGNFKGDTDGRSLIRVDNTYTSAGAAALQAGVSFVAYSNTSNQPSANKHEAQIILGSTGANSVTGGQTGTLQIVAPLDIAFNVSASNTIMTGSSYTTFGSNAMYLARSGNVGIGTTSPDLKLSVVSGSMRVASGASAGAIYFGKLSDGLYLQRDNDYDFSLVQNEASGYGLYLAGAGNVYVSIDANNNETDRAFVVQNNAVKTGTELFRVNEAGRVGVGTSLPTASIHVKPVSLGADLLILERYASQAKLIYAYESAADGYLEVRNGSDSAVSKLSGYSTTPSYFLSNVGVGTSTPNNRLHVYNSAGSSTTASNAIAVFEQNSNAGIQVCVPDASEAGLFFSRNGAAYYSAITRNGTDLLLKNGSATAVTINSSRNVGIGTTNPTFLLDVSGSSRHGFTSTNTHQFTGSVNINGPLTSSSSRVNGAFSATQIAEKIVTFTPLTGSITENPAWYRLISGSGILDSGRVRLSADYDNSRSDLEFTYAVRNYDTDGAGAFINITRASTYNNLFNAIRVIEGTLTTPYAIDVLIGNYLNNTSPATVTCLYESQFISAVLDTPTYVSASATGSNSNVVKTVYTTYTSGYPRIGPAYSDGLAVATYQGQLSVGYRGNYAYNNPSSLNYALLVSGSVGIGTTTLGEKLTVSGNSYIIGSTGAVGTGLAYYLGDSSNRDISLTRAGTAALAIGRYYPSAWAETVRFTADGNVGIGTSSPNSKLEVAGSSGTAIISVNNTTLGRSGSFGIDSSGVYIQNSNNGDYFDLKNATGVSRFRVIYDTATHLTTNFVSIGNLSATGSKLSVFGNLSVGSTYGSTAAPSNGAIFEGNVGVGTTSTTAKLHVYASGSSVNLLRGVTFNNSDASFNNASLEYYDTSTTNASTVTKVNYNAYFNKRGTANITGYTVGNFNGYTQIDSGSVNAVWDYASRIEVRNQATASSMYHFIADAGYVVVQGGVLGKATDRIGLYVRSQNQSSQTLTSQYGVYIEDLTSSINNYGIYSNISSAGNKYNIYAVGSADNYFAGNVGIGSTVPGAKLDVVGDLRVKSGGPAIILDTNAATDGRMEYKYNGTRKALIGVDSDNLQISADSGNYLQFRTNNTQRMIINNSGGVGIGTSSPLYLFDLYDTGANSAMMSLRSSGSGNARIYFDAANGDLVGSDYCYVGQDDSTLNFVINTANVAGDIHLQPKWNTSNGKLIVSGSSQFGLSPSSTHQFTGSVIGNFTSSRSVGVGFLGTSSWAATATTLSSSNISQFTNDSKYHYHRTDISSLSSSATNIVQPVSTFDYNNATNGPTNAWYNYFSSTHGDYLTSLIANRHRSADWYVAYKEGPGGTPTNPSWYLLLHTGNYNTYAPTLTGTGASGTWSITSSMANALNSANSYTVGSLTSTVQASGATGTLVSYVTPGIYANGSSTGNGIGLISNTSFANQGAIANIGLHQVSASVNDITAGVYMSIGGWHQNSATGLPVYIGGGYLSNSSSILSVVPTNTAGAGNVGIGTRLPGYKLDVNGDIRAMSGSTIRLQTSAGQERGTFQATDTTGAGGAGLAIATSGGEEIAFKDSSDVNMVIKGTGRVGIGTITPAEMLHISSSNNTQLRLESANDTAVQFVGPDTHSYALGLDLSDSSKFKISYNASRTPPGLGTNDRLVIDTSGNVGIGTAVPAAKLHVIGDISGSGQVRAASFFTTGAAGSSYFENLNIGTGIYIEGGANEGIYFGDSNRWIIDTCNAAHNDNADGELHFRDYTNSVTRMLIQYSTGNVGIGTTVPTARLHVTGSTGGVFEVDTSGSATTFYVSASGNVGIGSASPAYKLDVAGGDVNFATGTILRFGTVAVLNESSNANDIYANIRVIRNLSSVNQDGMYIGYGNSGGTSGHLRFYANNLTERMRIDASNGNVGIGITNPAAKLSVTGSGTGQMLAGDAGFGVGNYTGISVNGTLNTTAYNILSSPTDTNLYINRPSGNTIYFREANSDQMVLLTGGNLGIGTSSPSAKVQISGSANSVLLNVKSPISGNIVYVTGSGAVGINTTTPAFTLQVNGSFGATTKSFIIDHPTKEGKKLMYGSLESPYHGIRLTGRDTLVDGKCKIQLPEYMYKLILHNSVNIQLTGIKCNKTLYVDEINIPENYFTIAYDKGVFESYKDYDFFWDFTAVRADVPELQTEM